MPQTLLSPAKRVMSLAEPTKKMSKSDPKLKSRILITDSRDVIQSKLRTAPTDSIQGISYDRAARPGVSNLVDLLFHFDPAGAASPEELARDIKDLKMRMFKERITDAIDGGLKDIRGRYEELMGANQKELDVLADEGAQRAESRAEETMKKVRDVMGLGW